MMPIIKFGACPCCESRNLKKLKSESFMCMDCNAPLRFSWSPAHWIGLFLVAFLPSGLRTLPPLLQYGIPAVLFAVIWILYYRYRRFYLDDADVVDAINICNNDLRHINKFLSGKIGAIDFVAGLDSLKNTYTKEPAIQTLMQESFNRVGGLGIDEQAAGFAAAYPQVDLKEIALNQRQLIDNRIEQLKTYKITA